jgi:Domain of unknown function (DUF4417)
MPDQIDCGAMYGTRSSHYWAVTPGKIDALNLRYVYPAESAYGIPDLAPCDYLPENLAAWNVARQREYAAKTVGAIHFFLDDYRFESLWASPERLLPRVTAVGAALTPDFSVWRDMPLAAQVWNVYRSRWLGAYWQSHGVQVIPTVSWGRRDTFEFCFDGIPKGSTVAVSSVGVSAKDKALHRAGIRELIRRVDPQRIISYGRLRYCDGIELPEVVEYPTFWDRRRTT